MSTVLWAVAAVFVIAVVLYLYFWIRFQFWRRDFTKSIRKESIAQSRATILGKVTEHLAPIVPGFHYNPKDARFIGSPVDFVVFDGLDDGALRRVVLLEIKASQTAGLTSRERHIREAIQSRAIHLEWDVLRITGVD